MRTQKEILEAYPAIKDIYETGDTVLVEDDCWDICEEFKWPRFKKMITKDVKGINYDTFLMKYGYDYGNYIILGTTRMVLTEKTLPQFRDGIYDDRYFCFWNAVHLPHVMVEKYKSYWKPDPDKFYEKLYSEFGCGRTTTIEKLASRSYFMASALEIQEKLKAGLLALLNESDSEYQLLLERDKFELEY